MRPEERYTITSCNLLPRFGWQGEGEVAFLDERGDPLTTEQWKDRLGEKHRRLAEDR